MLIVCLSVLALGQPQDSPPPPVRSAVLTEDSRGRPVIEARLNGHPAPMVVDTAAQTSFVTTALAQEVGLPVLEDRMTINAASGTAEVALVAVDQYDTALFESRDVSLLTLPNAGVTEARGIIGMEMFSQGRLEFDNAADVLTFGPSMAAPADFVTISGRLDDSGLLIVPVEIDGVAFDALVDSGAAVTVADRAGLAALGWGATDSRLRPAGQITGATTHGADVHFGQIDRLKLGPVTFRDIAIVFTGVSAPDGAEPAAGAPSLILGTNLLRALDAYAVDLSRAELQIRRAPAVSGQGAPGRVQ